MGLTVYWDKRIGGPNIGVEVYWDRVGGPDWSPPPPLGGTSANIPISPTHRES